MDDLELRFLIYREIVSSQAVPTRPDLLGLVGDGGDLDRQLQRLHDAHMIVLDDRPHRRGEIRMALPFAAEPTDFTVQTSQGSWWANCAWDSLAVVAALHQDARIQSTWADTGEPFERTVVDGELDSVDGFVHFSIPASRWWDDIVET